MGDGSKRLPIRGGNWNNGANAGVFALNLNNPRTNANGNIGFRVALAPHVRSRASKGVRSRASKGARTAHGAKGTHLPTECGSQPQEAKKLIAAEPVSRGKPRTLAHAVFYLRKR